MKSQDTGMQRWFNHFRMFWFDTRAQATVEYVLVVLALIGSAGALNHLVESGYGEYIKGLYFVLGLPAP